MRLLVISAVLAIITSCAKPQPPTPEGNNTSEPSSAAQACPFSRADLCACWEAAGCPSPACEDEILACDLTEETPPAPPPEPAEPPTTEEEETEDEEGCDWDFDCGFGERCDEGQCISRAGDILMTCADQQDCTFGMTCQFGICIGCIDNIQCLPDGQCVMGTCVVAQIPKALNCLTQSCPDGERCDVTTGVCELICASDADCGEDQRCAPVLQRCIGDFGCEDVSDCQLLQQCVLGLCVGCQSDAGCKATEQCVLATCFPRFDQDSGPCSTVTCPQGDLCDPLNGACYTENGTCQNAQDCRPGHTCTPFINLCSGCSVDADCRASQRCWLGTCVPVQ